MFLLRERRTCAICLVLGEYLDLVKTVEKYGYAPVYLWE